MNIPCADQIGSTIVTQYWKHPHAVACGDLKWNRKPSRKLQPQQQQFVAHLSRIATLDCKSSFSIFLVFFTTEIQILRSNPTKHTNKYSNIQILLAYLILYSFALRKRFSAFSFALPTTSRWHVLYISHFISASKTQYVLHLFLVVAFAK